MFSTIQLPQRGFSQRTVGSCWWGNRRIAVRRSRVAPCRHKISISFNYRIACLNVLRAGVSGLQVVLAHSYMHSKSAESLGRPTSPCSIFWSCHYNGLGRLHFRIEVIHGPFIRHVSSTIEGSDAFGKYLFDRSNLDMTLMS